MLLSLASVIRDKFLGMRLLPWNGRSAMWNLLEKKSFYDAKVHGNYTLGNLVCLHSIVVPNAVDKVTPSMERSISSSGMHR